MTVCTCDRGLVEDEFHVFAVCPRYTDARQIMINSIGSDRLMSNDSFCALMSDSDSDKQRHIAHFVTKTFEIRTESLNM
jgi:hypothetical protein